MSFEDEDSCDKVDWEPVGQQVHYQDPGRYKPHPTFKVNTLPTKQHIRQSISIGNNKQQYWVFNQWYAIVQQFYFEPFIPLLLSSILD